MYETVLRTPYAGLGPLAGLGAYEIHERVAGLMNRNPRDYLYEFCAPQGVLYLRAATRSAGEEIPWRELTPLIAGGHYKVLGRIALDYHRLEHRAKVTSYAVRRSDFARVLAPLLAERAGLGVSSLEVWTEPTVAIRKPGRGEFHFVPINFAGTVTIEDLERARAAHERGFGRARGFGFGVLHFRPQVPRTAFPCGAPPAERELWVARGSRGTDGMASQ